MYMTVKDPVIVSGGAEEDNDSIVESLSSGDDGDDEEFVDDEEINEEEDDDSGDEDGKVQRRKKDYVSKEKDLEDEIMDDLKQPTPPPLIELHTPSLSPPLPPSAQSLPLLSLSPTQLPPPHQPTQPLSTQDIEQMKMICGETTQTTTTTTTTTTTMSPPPPPPVIPVLSPPSYSSSSSSSRNDNDISIIRVAPPRPQFKPRYYELHSKTLGLTYSACPVDKTVILQHLMDLLRPNHPQVIICASELHRDAQQHLHVFIKLPHQKCIRDNRLFDYHQYHPYVQSVRDEYSWILYITKDDTTPACHPVGLKPREMLARLKLESGTNRKRVGTFMMAEHMIKMGKDNEEIERELPGFMLNHLKKVRDYRSELAEREERKGRPQLWKAISKFAGKDNPTNQLIANWLNENLLQPHKFRQKNLWISGPTQMGKTTLVEMLGDVGFIVYNVDYGTHFYTGMHDGVQLMVFDEFKGQKTIPEMNKLGDGSRCLLDMKGASYRLKRPLPVIVISNFTPEQCYPQTDPQYLQTLKGRFHEITVESPISIEYNYLSTPTTTTSPSSYNSPSHPILIDE